MFNKRFIGSDVAQLAFWDVQHTRVGTEEMELQELDDLWKADALGGRVFFINTGRDGAWDVHLYVDEAIPDEVLNFYKTLNRRFLLRCPSGRLIADGAEFYMASAEETPSSEDAIQFPAGDYELQLHELCAADLDDPAHLEAIVGRDDVDYYLSKNPGFGWGCVGLIAGALIGAVTHWSLGLLIAITSIGLTALKQWRHKRDTRFTDIETRLDEDRNRYAYFICSLRRIEGDTELRGGWYNFG
jgi:hypothetical protein